MADLRSVGREPVLVNILGEFRISTTPRPTGGRPFSFQLSINGSLHPSNSWVVFSNTSRSYYGQGSLPHIHKFKTSLARGAVSAPCSLDSVSSQLASRLWARRRE